MYENEKVEKFQFRDFEIFTSKDIFPVNTDSILFGALVNCIGFKNGLDIGTGNGILSIFFSRKCPQLNITALDIDNRAIEIANKNFVNYSRIRAIFDDFNHFAQNSTEQFDFIFSNPPYFESDKLPRKQNFIIGKHTVMLSYKDLIKGVSLLLKENGKFSLIIPFRYMKKLIYLAGYYGLYEFHRIYIKYSKQKPIFRVILEFAKEIRNFSEKTFIIAEGNDYSQEYKQLVLKYLKQ